MNPLLGREFTRNIKPYFLQKIKVKKLKCRLLQFLFGSLRVKRYPLFSRRWLEDSLRYSLLGYTHTLTMIYYEKLTFLALLSTSCFSKYSLLKIYRTNINLQIRTIYRGNFLLHVQFSFPFFFFFFSCYEPFHT